MASLQDQSCFRVDGDRMNFHSPFPVLSQVGKEDELRMYCHDTSPKAGTCYLYELVHLFTSVGLV